VHQSKFSMGTVLGLIAVDGHAGLAEFDAHYRDPAVVAFRDRVAMELDDEVDRAYPARWIGKVTVETTDGRRFDGRVDEPKGDPGNTLSPAELEEKAVRLARYRDGASEAEARRVAASARLCARAALSPAFLARAPHGGLFLRTPRRRAGVSAGWRRFAAGRIPVRSRPGPLLPANAAPEALAPSSRREGAKPR
jgi:hypothetical protein